MVFEWHRKFQPAILCLMTGYWLPKLDFTFRERKSPAQLVQMTPVTIDKSESTSIGGRIRSATEQFTQKFQLTRPVFSWCWNIEVWQENNLSQNLPGNTHKILRAHLRKACYFFFMYMCTTSVHVHSVRVFLSPKIVIFILIFSADKLFSRSSFSQTSR